MMNHKNPMVKQIPERIAYGLVGLKDLRRIHNKHLRHEAESLLVNEMVVRV